MRPLLLVHAPLDELAASSCLNKMSCRQTSDFLLMNFCKQHQHDANVIGNIDGKSFMLSNLHDVRA